MRFGEGIISKQSSPPPLPPQMEKILRANPPPFPPAKTGMYSTFSVQNCDCGARQQWKTKNFLRSGSDTYTDNVEKNRTVSAWESYQWTPHGPKRGKLNETWLKAGNKLDVLISKFDLFKLQKPRARLILYPYHIFSSRLFTQVSLAGKSMFSGNLSKRLKSFSAKNMFSSISAVARTSKEGLFGAQESLSTGLKILL